MGSVSYERQPIADHAINLASTIQLNLKRSLEALGVVRPSSVPQIPLEQKACDAENLWERIECEGTHWIGICCTCP